MPYHENSALAYWEDRIKLSRRETEVFGAIARLGRPTARQILKFLERHDLNEVRPRISDLKKKGLIIETGKVRDEKSKKMVSTFQVNMVTEHPTDPPADPEPLDPRPYDHKERKEFQLDPGLDHIAEPLGVMEASSGPMVQASLFKENH
jgi:hypothetical protein